MSRSYTPLPLGAGMAVAGQLYFVKLAPDILFKLGLKGRGSKSKDTEIALWAAS
jgi:hypothetical protein